MRIITITSYTNSVGITAGGDTKYIQKGSANIFHRATDPDKVRIQATGRHNDTLLLIDYSQDTISIDGTTSFASIIELVSTLQSVFFLANSNGGDGNTERSAGKYLSILNTDTTTDIASTVTKAFAEAFGVVSIDTLPGTYSVDLNLASITFNESGLYELNAFWGWAESVASNTQRNTMNIWFEDGTGANNDDDSDNISPDFWNNYVRDASGANEAGQSVAGWWVNVASAPFTIFLRRKQVGGSGGQMALSGTSNYINVKKLE